MKIVRITLAAAVLALAAFSYGCGPAEGEKMEWSKTGDNAMDGKTVTIEGYAELPSMMYTYEGTTELNFMERFNQYDASIVKLMLTDGEGSNCISSIPDDYYQTDIMIHDKDGKTIEYGDKMKVTGTAKFESGSYTITVETIEKIESGFDYEKEAARLTESDWDKLDGKMVWSEGEVYVADEQSTDSRMDMWVVDTTLSYDIIAKFNYGPAANQADVLPESYLQEDVWFRDSKGDEYGDGSTVRVYGIWDANAEEIAVEKIVGVE